MVCQFSAVTLVSLRPATLFLERAQTCETDETGEENVFLELRVVATL
jgi:hypothetical protein